MKDLYAARTGWSWNRRTGRRRRFAKVGIQTLVTDVRPLFARWAQDFPYARTQWRRRVLILAKPSLRHSTSFTAHAVAPLGDAVTFSSPEHLMGKNELRTNQRHLHVTPLITGASS